MKKQGSNKLFSPTRLIIGALVVIVAAFVVYQAVKGASVDPAKKALAECMTQKGIVMYGADWCPHCQHTESNFGPAFKYVDYVACEHNVGDPLAPVCQQHNVTAFPTWINPNGSRTVGMTELGSLAAWSNCTAALAQR